MTQAWQQDLRTIAALMRRGLNEILRVPAGAIPGVLAPTIFMLGLSAAFGEAARLPGFSAEDFRTFIVPVGLLQGAGFSGAATGVNLARDIERGWFDRLMLAPAKRPVLLAGVVGSACLRCLLPASFLLIVSFSLGVSWPGVGALVLAALMIMGLAAAAACYATVLALRFRTQQAAPLMQVGTFISVLFTTAYVPRELLSDWLRAIADVNPVTHVLEGVRQGFVGDVTWATTWPALVALAGLVTVFGTLAVRAMRRQGY
ncbi:MAG TPA: ABC transporter permease [Solirubrobacteraceae bacterium]|nr:ABC transporter permease [Solirubrobacteraceae bacterium]